MKLPLLPVLAVLILCFSSCNKEVKPLSKEEVGKKIDSAVNASVQESDHQAQVDLEHRIKIEVKVKADSIITARQRREAGDTVAPKPLPIR